MKEIRPTDEVQSILNAAYREARGKKHEFITPEHILYCALTFDNPRALIRKCGADPDEIRIHLETFFKEHMSFIEDAEPVLTDGWREVIERTVIHMSQAGKNEINSSDIIVAIFDLDQSFAAYYMREAGIARLKLLEVVSHPPQEQVGKESESNTTDSSGPRPAGERKGKGFLEKFAVDLTAKARAGELEPLIGREDIIERTLQVLGRRLKNNPVHVGEPGVGKTAVTEGLASLIVKGDVPDFVAGHRIYCMDTGAVVAGTRFRGDFEERVKGIISELENEENVILFIDEIHTVIGAGSVQSGGIDASSLLKPALLSGKLRCIGSTTHDEFRKYVERDHGLARRFQKIEVPEPTSEEAYRILLGLRGAYELHHGVVYENESLKAAVELSVQYMNEKYLPDKAIDIIDEAGSWKRLTENKKLRTRNSPETNIPNTKSSLDLSDGEAPEIASRQVGEAENRNSVQDTEAGTAMPIGVPDNTISAVDREKLPVITISDIEKVISKIARIPEKTVSAHETDRLQTLAEDLRQVIFGQDDAVAAVAEAIKRSRAGFRKPDKPVANFLFVGPTGVGKTELTRCLAEKLGVHLHRFDMSEYQEKHTVSRILGSPPGYVGYEEGGILTEAIRKTPHAVLLLDEIEKAHPDIFNVLLQVMDYATMTDNMGRKADFRNVIIIMTSNAGAREISKTRIGFGQDDFRHSALDEAVNRMFSPEFRNRLDKVVKFRQLPVDVVKSIVKKEICSFQEMLSSRDINLEIDDSALSWIAEKGYSREYGARNIVRLVEDKIKSFFVDQVLFGDLSSGGSAFVELKDGDIHIWIEKKDTERA